MMLARRLSLCAAMVVGHPGAAATPSNGRVVLDEAAAAIILKHIRKACGRIAELAPKLATDDARRQLAGVSRRLDRISAGILRAHTDLADRGVSGVRTQDAKVRIGPATARHLRWALKDAGAATRIEALADSPCAKAPEATARTCVETLIDLNSEIGFAASPIHKAYPDLQKLTMDELREANRRRPRQPGHDEAFRKNAPPLGSVTLSPAVVAFIRPFMTAIENQDKGCHVAAILWSLGGSSKRPDDAEWTKSGPGLTLGSHYCDRVPADVIHTIDGLRVVFMGDGPDRFRDKIVDLDGKRLVLRDR